MTDSFQAWLDSHEGEDWHWYIKRLSANDTLASESHQAGPYLPNHHAFIIFPSLKTSDEANPKVWLRGATDSHGTPERELVTTWYRAAKNECRITRWGGKSSAVLDPESTGAVTVFAFHKSGLADAHYVSVWVCNIQEEDLLSERIGPIEPGIPRLISRLDPRHEIITPSGTCVLTKETIPPTWLSIFPTGEEIINKCIELRRLAQETPDKRLIERRTCEFEMFQSIETLHVLPRIKLGFSAVSEFIEYSNSVNNRRKSRSGRSLELHVREILREEQVPFSHGEISEGNKRPDFLFPSAAAYRNKDHPIWMLAAKTTCKDRWRQVLNEADNIPRKHLITLQEGVSVNQHNEMEQAGLTLVVPAALHESFPAILRPKLMDLTSFVAMVLSRT